MQTPLKTTPRLVCFGEVLARFSTRNFLPLADATELEVHFAGAEANVAAQFAAFGGDASLVTRFPSNRFATACQERLRARGVSLSHCLHGGARLGLYFLEPGIGARSSVITYDRAHSAFSEIAPGMFDWEACLANAHWFHWSGITPPLGPQTAAVCAEAVAAARKLGLQVSCDINYRGALWSMEQAASILPPLIHGTDLLFCGATEARKILRASDACSVSDTSSASGSDEGLQALAESLKSLHAVKHVAMLVRSGETADGGTLRGMFSTPTSTAFSRTHELSVVDRIGSGDSFAGALLHAVSHTLPTAEAVEFATAAAVWKHTIPGDWNRGSLEEIRALALGAGGAFVRR